MKSEKATATNFSEAVVHELVPLLASVGFCVFRIQEAAVIFQSNNVEIEVYWDTRSFEMGLDLSWIMYPEERYAFSEILLLWNHPEADGYLDFVATKPQSIAVGAQRMHRLLADLLKNGMQFDEAAHISLQKQKIRLAEKMEREVRDRHARRVVTAAWERQDFLSVVNALEDIQGDLTALELQRLQYAKNKNS